MKNLFPLIIVSILTSLLLPVRADGFRAHYELKTEFSGGNSSVVQTSSNVTFGTPIIHEFGDYQLSLLFEPSQEEADQYILEISLKLVPRGANSIDSTIVSTSFAGRISSPSDFSQSEFTIDEAGTSISIVLRLSRVM